MSVCYNQQDTLVRNILRIISERKPSSLLDIGAGGPVTGCQLRNCVTRYVAIEQDAIRARTLQEAGLEAICARFPVNMREQFDVVLSSHSIPEPGEATLDDYSAFVEAAWARVAPGGLLLIITFKGGAEEVGKLTSAVFAGTDAPPREGGSKEYATLMSLLADLGAPEVERVCSHIVADTAEELLLFITPWINGTKRLMNSQQNTRLRRIINSQYMVRPELYVLPTSHLFITLEKNN